jgi:hypothetical protein
MFAGINPYSSERFQKDRFFSSPPYCISVIVSSMFSDEHCPECTAVDCSAADKENSFAAEARSVDRTGGAVEGLCVAFRFEAGFCGEATSRFFLQSAMWISIVAGPKVHLQIGHAAVCGSITAGGGFDARAISGDFGGRDVAASSFFWH